MKLRIRNQLNHSRVSNVNYFILYNRFLLWFYFMYSFTFSSHFHFSSPSLSLSFTAFPSMADSLVPPWLEALLTSPFFTICRSHDDSPRSERNMFCLDCPSASAFCFYCRSTSHFGHRTIQVSIRYPFHRSFVFNSSSIFFYIIVAS